MADDTDRNVWDVIGLPNNADRASIEEIEQSLCTNGSQEVDLDKAQSVHSQGTSPNQKGTADPITLSIADASCSTDFPEEPVQNDGDRIEEIIQRCSQHQGVMNVSTNEARDLPAEKAHLSNGETSATPLEHSASVVNGAAESNVELLRNHLSDVKERDGVVAVSDDNNDRAELPDLRQERSIFEHINNSFRSPVVLSQNRVNENVVNGTGILTASIEARASSNANCLAVAEEKQETPGIVTDENNIFERARIDSFIDSLAQRTNTTREGNGGFPFSEKLRQLTNISKDSGNNMSTTVQALRTGYDAVTSGRSFQQLAPMSASNSRSNTISARIVNGQLQPVGMQPVGTQVLISTEPPKVDSNLIFPSVTPITYANPASSSLGVKNPYATQDVVSGCNNNTNSVAIQPNPWKN
ncbi:hypothetical protein OS493_013033 [Desmophyllum pertusum]|uniref:Uncharacterized protein n=1 Tax=Desmophyllum pertusum TaxID=174260 RepID=A0A9X0CTB2_9CNID|nr:hypothetical protein OS493_013033 [Desmophyllum pertusum]